MNYKELENNYISYFKTEYEEFINALIREVRKDKNVIDFSEYTSKTVEKPKEITFDFLKLENIKDHIFTDNVTFSLNYSFYLEFLSHNDRVKLDSELFNEIISHNNIHRKMYDI